MAKCKSCKCSGRVMSSACKCVKDGCTDVCVNPICGEANVLGINAPVIYDEIGINVCATFPLGVDISATYPTAVSASAQLLDLSYDYGEGNVEITQIAGRPNCYLVELSNLTANFAIKIYDNTCRLLDTIFVTSVYLPPDTTAPTYDEDTNPSSVTLEVFAPYGISYNSPADGGEPTPALNFIGFLSENNFVRQGINLYAIPKVVGFNEDEDTISIGLTLVVQSVYFAGYLVATQGKVNTPKGSLIPEEDSDCRCFVAGELLNLAIKPLELGCPDYEENLKNDCSDMAGACSGVGVCEIANPCENETMLSCNIEE